MMIFKPGTWVKIGDDVTATIRQVCIVEGGMTYEVVWWDGKTRSTAWLAPHEVRGDATPKTEIGFRTNPPSLSTMGVERVGLMGAEPVSVKSNGAH